MHFALVFQNERADLKQDLEKKNEKELSMFEYLSGVVKKRDVEISDLKQESVEVKTLVLPCH